jgi:hypothetical protein
MKTNKTKNNSSEQVNIEIENIINNNSIEYVKNSISTIKSWNILTGILATFKYLVLILLVPTLTFASTTYTQHNLNFVAGILSLVGIAFEKMGKYCETNSKRKVEKLNKILREYGNNIQIQDDSEYDIDDTDEQTENNRDFVLKTKSKKNIKNKNTGKNVCSIAFGE